ncbi:hypothetical protein BDW59DRAFT_154110 [Aspergillus cavernicola]|uniref:DH domain-containing protein n=1 Tax=Aspergillus cavernicola TaxID=176166 RepID=A0ABR4HHF7_9EURO
MELSIESLFTVEESNEPFPEPVSIHISTPESEEKLCEGNGDVGIYIDPGFASPFKRWVNSLRPKKTFPVCQPQRHVEGWSHTPRASCDNTHLSLHYGSQEQQWEQLSRTSSHLGTVKTPSLSIASQAQSVVRSRRTTQSSTNTKSLKSGFRCSIDSLKPTSSISIDEEAQSRTIKRVQVLHEIVTTESDYVFGLKALTNLLMILSARPEIYHNVQRIRETHESFLSRVRDVMTISSVCDAELERLTVQAQKRSHTVDLSLKAFQPRSLRTHKLKTSISCRLKELAGETNEALKVAQEIETLSQSFVLYKEFCENYKLLHQDTSLLRDSVKNWPGFEQGIEALTKSAASIEARSLYENKSLCLNDIIIKPAQRLCKYPLLLEELLKWTHIKDDPSAHDGIRQVLESIREKVAEVNEATTITLNRTLIEKTFLLQEMLDPKSATIVDLYKQLGPMTLCGALYITYQASSQVTGAFMVCVLFKHHFFVAKMNEEYRRLQPLACLYISDVRMDSLSNGKGLEYFCTFSWKLLFQLHDEKFELVLSASSAAEEKQWKTDLRASSFSVLGLVPLQDVSALTPQLSRRPSLQTLGMPRVRSTLRPIIIRKTNCPHKNGQTQPIDGELDRPKAPPPGPASIITARRHERVRLERVILPIYTRDALPYPGMILAKGDFLFGSGALIRLSSIRPKRYKRSSSINLPTPLQNLGEPQDIDKTEDKIHGTKRGKRRDTSEFSHSLEHEKCWMLHKDSVIFLGRSKTVRVKPSPRLSYTPSPQPLSKGYKSSEHSDTPPRKGIWSIFNSMSLRKSKKNARPALVEHDDATNLDRSP